jgi:hypothetical protein
MIHNKLLLSAASLILALVWTAMAQKVSVDYDRGADFSSYRTYSFIESKQPASSQLWSDRILDNIQLKLAINGLLPARSGEVADLFVVYNAGVKELTAIEGYTYNYGPGWRWSWSESHSQAYAVVQERGTLVIDLIDARQNRLVWRGVATGTLSEQSDKNLKKIGKATGRMFAKYPSKGKWTSAERLGKETNKSL